MDSNALKNVVLPLVSVIIPAYNSEDTIERCVRAVLSQDYPCFEVIIVDDASQDSTVARLTQFVKNNQGRHVSIITKSKNRGAGHSRNIGARQAQADLLVFVDSDIIILAGGVSRITKTITDDPGIIASGCIYSDNTMDFDFVSDYKNLDLAYRAALSTGFVKYLSSCFLAVKKDVFWTAGGFSCNFTGATVEDLDFCYKAGKGRNSMFINKDIVVDHLKHYNLVNMFKTDYNRVIDMMRIIRSSKGQYKAGEQATGAYCEHFYSRANFVVSLPVLSI